MRIMGGDCELPQQQKKKLEAARDRVGKCPACNQAHTYKSRWSTQPWPSDRFVSCQKFSNMSTKQRAETLQRASGCVRCTSWTHRKADCRQAAVDCKQVVNGAVCHRDHSVLVCNSGVAYCMATKSHSNQYESDIDIFPVTLHYLQDAKL